MFSTRRLCLDFVRYSDKVVITREDVDGSLGIEDVMSPELRWNSDPPHQNLRLEPYAKLGYALSSAASKTLGCR